jgi:hypothetical protein
MKKLFLFAWLMMLSIVATAQSIIVVDKDGNRISYDPTKVTSVDFQTTPPGFTVRQATSSDLYLFDKVSSVKGLPDHLFVYPDTAVVKTEGESFALQVKASVEYVATPSERWLTIDDDAKDGQQYVTALPNPTAEERTGYIAFASKDQSLTDTLWVIQAGMQLSWIKLVNPKDEEMLPGTPHKLTYRLLYMDEAGQGTGTPGYSMKLRITGNGVFDNQQKEIILTSDEEGLISTNVTCSSLEEGGGLVQILQPEQEYALPQNPTWIFHPTSFRLVSMKPQQLIEAGQKSVDVSFKLIHTVELFSVDETSDLEGISVLTYKHLSTTELAYPEQQIHFSAQNGGADVRSAKTDEMGVATATFTPSGDDFTEGTLTGTYYVELAEDDISDIKAVTHITKASLTVTPDTVRVRADGEDFTFVVTANTDYDIKPSVSWLTEPTELPDVDGVMAYSAAMNPSTEQRTGYLVFVSASGLTTDTLYVVQAGKEDSRYIDIDWETTTLDSYDSDTGAAVLTFAGDVPVMGEYDVVLIPNELGNLLIRVIESVEQADKTVTIKTMAGDMGNLFRDQEFTLELGDDGTASARSTDAGAVPVIRPEKVEIFEDGRYVEVYNANTALSRSNRAPATQDLSFNYEDTYKTIWQGDDRRGVLQLDKCKLAMKMKGTISYTFKKEPWYKVWRSDVTKTSIMFEGDWESEMLLNTVSNTPNLITVTPDGWASTDPMLQKGFIQRRYTFTVDGIPVQVVLDGDLRCSYGLRLNGIANIKSGLKLGKHFKYGMALDTEKAQPDTYTCEETIDRSKTELIYPEMEAGTAEYKNSIAYGRADVYPIFNVNFYGNGVESSFHFHEWLHSKTASWEPEPQFAPGYLARRALVGRFRSVHMHMMNIPNTIFELNQIYGENFWSDAEGDVETLLRIPEHFVIEQPKEPTLIMMQGEEQELKVQAYHYDHVSGEKIPTAGVLMEFETDESANNKILKYTDEDGYASTKIKKGTKPIETLSYKLFVREPELENPIEEIKQELKLLRYYLYCLTPTQEVEKGAKDVPVLFQLMKSEGNDVKAAAHQRIDFTATGGTVSPRYGYTDADGKVYAYVTPEDGADQSIVKADVYIKRNNVEWSDQVSATVWVKKGEDPCAVDDPDLQKANQQENTYVVKNKKTGETVTRPYNPDYSEWTKKKDFISFQLNDEEVDAQGNPNTKGMLYGHIPLTMRGVILMLTGQQFENTPGAKVGFGLYDKFFVSTDFMCMSGEGGTMITEGEIKGDGKSKILIRKPCNQKTANARRALGEEQEEEEYTDEYELLYYLVFTTHAYNPETQQEEEVELEVYGKGTMKMHVPSITYFVLSNDKDWVRVGESTKVTLERYDEYGAVWDWNDVQIIGQSSKQTEARNGTDEGFFSWDAATQTLTSLKSNDNKDVWVYLGLKSNPGVKAPVLVATGEGWKYTMIKTSEAVMEQKANSYFRFDFDWAPKESSSEKMDFNALELDPESNPNGYFVFPYSDTRWPVFCRSNTPPGEYTLRFRVKSNHDVNCTMKFIIKPE